MENNLHSCFFIISHIDIIIFKERREIIGMKVGILGAGHIASIMARTIEQMDGVICIAIASRNKMRAKKFAHEYHCVKYFGAYEEMLQDNEVELVYIATPHSYHCEHIKMCIQYGKHILCEKAFTVNAIQAKEVIKLAREKNILLAEAMWTRYMPLCKKMLEIIEFDTIGKVHLLTANIGGAVSGMERIEKSELAGGALLDLSVYPLNFALMILGKEIEEIKSMPVMNHQGVDLQNSILLKYKNGIMAVLYATTLASTDRNGVVYGDKGYVKMTNINSFPRIEVYNNQHNCIEIYEDSSRISGYEYEILATIKAIEMGALECVEMPHSETVYIMELLDSIRSVWGMHFVCE